MSNPIYKAEHIPSGKDVDVYRHSESTGWIDWNNNNIKYLAKDIVLKMDNGKPIEVEDK